jgi:hypothetical protein
MAKDTFYFSHDYNARNDDKIKSLLRKHGMAGYGIFWAIVEELYNNANALRTHYERIAYDLRTDEITIKSIVEDFELFQISEGFFGSCSIEKRLDERNAKSKSARLSAFSRWNKKNANASDNNANASKNDAIKESIVNKIKESKELNVPFEDFWNLYDKKVDRKSSESKWTKLTDEEREKSMNHIPNYIKATQDKQYRKNPDTYLNNKSFNDEIIDRNSNQQNQPNSVNLIF